MLKWAASVVVSSAVAITTAYGSPDQDLITAAKKEGELVWYSTAPLAASGILSDAFQTKYGIHVSMFRGVTFEIYQRISAEQQAHKPIADVVHGSDVPGFLSLTTSGLLRRYESPERANYPDYAKDHDGYWTAMRITASFIVYNTDKVDASSAPKSWRDGGGVRRRIWRPHVLRSRQSTFSQNTPLDN